MFATWSFAPRPRSAISSMDKPAAATLATDDAWGACSKPGHGTDKVENVQGTGASLSLRGAFMAVGMSSSVCIRLGKGCPPRTRYAALAISGEPPCGEGLPSAASYERLAGVQGALDARSGASAVREIAGTGAPGRERSKGLPCAWLADSVDIRQLFSVCKGREEMMSIFKQEVAGKKRQLPRVAPSSGNLAIPTGAGGLGNGIYNLVSSNLFAYRKRPKPINKPWCRSTM